MVDFRGIKSNILNDFKSWGKMSNFKYTSSIIRKMQLIELEMLKEVDNICRRNNITYIIDGGTLLGAVRYGGFIPWDDDVDVRMLRSEYDRFCEVCESQLDKEKYFLQTYKTDSGYRWGYARILRKGTFFDREHQEMLTMRRGIFIDIFPCDGMPDKQPDKVVFNFRCYIARKILYSLVGAKYEKNILKKIGYKILKYIPKEIAHNELERMAAKFYRKDTRLVRILGWGAREESEGFLRDWFLQTKNILFEGIEFPAPKDTDGFLKLMFGEDYMTPPPKNQQKPKHIAVNIDFGEL